MSAMRGSYGAALRVTMRNTAAAYGYTLSTGATIGVLTDMAGKPDAGKLFLFVIGGVIAFVLLEALVSASGTPAPQPPEQAIPFAGALNAASVGAALGMAILIAHFVRSPVAWFLAQMATTAVYMLVVAVQITVAEAVQRRVSDTRLPRGGAWPRWGRAGSPPSHPAPFRIIKTFIRNGPWRLSDRRLPDAAAATGPRPWRSALPARCPGCRGTGSARHSRLR